ncbi:MAG: TetR/AcrR family transcriptional regulator [Endozoicomonas sp.]
MARPQQYNREKVIDQAMQLFWKQGYQATPVSDLVQITGLRPGSLYGAFGNKEGLLLAALEFYTQQVESLVAEVFNRYSSAREGVTAFLQTLASEVNDGKLANGCLLVNTLLEMAGNNREICTEVDRLLRRIENSFQAAFLRAREEGDLPDQADCSGLATYMMGTVWSLRVMSRLSTDRQRMQAIVGPALRGMFG